MAFVASRMGLPFLAAVLLAAASSFPAMGGAAAADAVPPPPNVVVVLVDDLGALDGRLLAALPNIRRVFSERGVTFSDAHVETPLCCPGRAGFLTGQHTFRHGVVRNEGRLLDPSMTIATQANAVGYHTFWAGKYFNGYESIPDDRKMPAGWDRFSGFPANTLRSAYYDYRLWNFVRAENGTVTSTIEDYGSLPAHHTAEVTLAKAVASIRAAPATQPFMGWISFSAPHAPQTPAPRHIGDPRCASIPKWAPANYNESDVTDKPAYVQARPLLRAAAFDLGPVCRSLLVVDEAVGTIESVLARRGQLRNTIFIFTSDNGMDFGAHRALFKTAPTTTQIPFHVSWPARLGWGARTVTERIQNIDLASTICEYARCTMGPYPNGQERPDGISFAPLLTGQRSSLPRDALLTDLPVAFLDVPAWYAVTTTRESPLAARSCAAHADRGCRWHYIEYETGERELYDLSNGPCWEWSPGRNGDPCRMTNRAGDAALADVEFTLSVKLSELKGTTPARALDRFRRRGG
jgi:arylsulfatase A-like enzyme